MIKSIGTDLVEISRIKELDIKRFAERILSSEELEIFNDITDDNRRHTFIAGRFAAKEALFKCFKQGDKTANYKDFIILNDSHGAPYVSSRFIEGLTCHITITHTNEHAIAFVVLENL
ncbi:holo-ACP synthase [Acholeplasma hippikon]|uniref:Holo-[acyl-carrier-protein] synthase n=1 Tax=Acholeplasma hippikon TaxID=264636 RepID=A0A449BKV5_9MOLU|nr:holo-ACP synthase [Acholeplasma hippikon]VEU83105.1 holo-(acyl-carrier-protein) synthase [Acholeplasma hippikon]